MIGKTLAHYEITGLLGKGGMGEVYRALDTKLGRDVAIKVLPKEFSGDPERAARFEREARTLASLQHPNVASIYGFEEVDGNRFLVMELVQGKELTARLGEGKLPLETTMRIARQIATGLEAAHDGGIVHRDLKPANIMLNDADEAKILDFGLARAWFGDADGDATIEHSPTITAAMTQAGTILGTAAYMSPEQARGKNVDRRADIWAFGAILWEMVTGERLFQGETISDTLAAVLRAEPQWDLLPVDEAPDLCRLIERCLVRDPQLRLRDIGEARILLQDGGSESSVLSMHAMETPAAQAPPQPARAPILPWIVAGVAAAAALFFWFNRPEPTSAPPIRMEIQLPFQSRLGASVGVNIQLSPDGELLAYRTVDGIYVRRLDTIEATLLKGTDGVLQFTFSPDGKWIAFIAEGTIRRVSIDGGDPVEICEADNLSRGIAWVDPQTIVFVPRFVGGMKTVDLETGEVRELTTVDEEAGERSHRWPTVLPGGRSILYLCQFHEGNYDDGEIRMLTLGDSVSTTVYRGGAAPLYSPSGHLLFAKDNTVFAIPLDLKTRETMGLAVPVLSEVWSRVNEQETDDGSAQFDVSPQGMLIYQTEPGGDLVRISSVDVATKEIRSLTEALSISSLRISPDGRAVLYRQGGEIHMLDLVSGGARQLSFAAATVRVGAWSPDSKIVYWQSSVDDSVRLLSRPVDGSEPATVVRSGLGFGRPTHVSPDGEWILLTEWPEDRGNNEFAALVLRLTDPDAKAKVLVDEPGSQLLGRFSPDGRWVAYTSRDVGSFGIYLRHFPDTGARWLVASTEETSYHEWLTDGTGLMFYDGRGTFRVAVDLSSGNPSIGMPVPFVPTTIVPIREAGNNSVTFAPDASMIYFLKRESVDEEDDAAIILVTDWLSELNELTSR